MISGLSSYIELFAAVYLTICLDDMLLKRFWTPDYEKEMTESLAKIDMPILAKNQVISKTKVISIIEENRSRKRGVILFCLSVLLLIISGFEDCLNNLSYGNVKNIVVLLLITFSIIVFLYDNTFLKNGWQVIKWLLIIPLLTLVSCVCLNRFTDLEKLIKNQFYWEIGINVIVILALLIPVIWQLLRNWIYTRFYLLYIVEQTKEKSQNYNYAIQFNQNKGDKMTDVAKNYMNLVAKNIAIGTQDRQITDFYQTLMDDLDTIDYIPEAVPLIKFSKKMHKKYYPSNNRLKRLSRRYDTYKKKPLLEDYCRNNNIDPEKLRDYRKQNGL